MYLSFTHDTSHFSLKKPYFDDFSWQARLLVQKCGQTTPERDVITEFLQFTGPNVRMQSASKRNMRHFNHIKLRMLTVSSPSPHKTKHTHNS